MLRLLVATLLASLVPLTAQDVNPAGQPFPEVALPQVTRATGIAGALGPRLPEVARWYGKTEEELRALLQRDRSIIADRSGRLAYACSGLVAPEDVAAAAAAADEPKGIVYPPAQTFFLHSRPGSNRKIYLDFDGHTTSGTLWNSGFNSGNNFTTPPYDIDGNTATFSSTELSRIQGIWKRVAEDFAPYDVDVTTEDPGVEGLRRSPSTDQAYGIRVCIGGSSYDWYRRGAGGVAYIGSFNWTNDTPTYAFTAQLGNGNEKYTAEATSHEVGHTLGLNHDGQTDGTEYYGGHGNWAPIMGVGYSKEVVQWSKGEYPLANNLQDDTAVMPNYGAPLRADDAGDTRATAAALNDLDVSVDGIIHTRADRDFYSFSTGAGPVSFSTASPSASPNLDVALTLYDVAGGVVTTSDPVGMTASINATVAAGTYYVGIEGVAPGNPATSYNDYGSLGGYELRGTIQSTAENFVSVVATDAEAAETAQFTPPNTGTFTFRRLVVNAQPLVVPFTIGGTATGLDYTMPTTVTIPAGMPTASIIVKPTDDSVGDGSKTVVVTLSPSPNYSLSTTAGSATVTIRDNDLQEVSLFAPATQTSENSATPLTLTLSRSAKAPTPLTVYLLIGGTAQPGVDYDALPTIITFAPGEDRRELLLQPRDNDVFNATLTVTVQVADDLEYKPGFQSAATIRIFNEELPPDPNKPSVTISSPKLKQRFPAPITSLIATGTAKDNLAVARVQYRVNGGNWQPANLAQGGWTAEIGTQVAPGTNLLEAQAEDEDANLSSLAAVTFVVVKPRNLEVIVQGPGTVSPGTGSFEVMQVYTLKAKPQAGKIFAGWTGDLAGSGKAMAFTMPDADLQVTATFVDNPFSEGVIGKYTGLVQGDTEAPETSGLLSMAVTKTGVATGKLCLGGKTFPVRGEFNGLGNLHTAIKVPKQPSMQVALNLDMNPNGTQRITGTITGAAGISNAEANRAPYDARKNPLPAEFARAYTFHLPPHTVASLPADTAASPPLDPDTAPKPEGHGVGILSINSSGIVKWTGTLGDGSPAAQTTLLDAQKRWPLYAPLYKARGYLAGEVTHDPAAVDHDLSSADLNWVKPPNPMDQYFPGGFRITDHGLFGVNYTAPARGSRVLPGYDAAPNNAGPLSLQEGNLVTSLLGELALLPTNATLTTSTLENLKISINAKSGLVGGSFVFPLTRKVTPIKGVILQGKIGKGVAFFPGSTLNNTALQTGRLEFAPATTP